MEVPASIVVRQHFKPYVHLWAPHYKKNIEVLEHIQRRAMEMVKGLENKLYEEQLKDLGLLSLGKRRLGGEPPETML